MNDLIGTENQIAWARNIVNRTFAGGRNGPAVLAQAALLFADSKFRRDGQAAAKLKEASAVSMSKESKVAAIARVNDSLGAAVLAGLPVQAAWWIDNVNPQSGAVPTEDLGRYWVEANGVDALCSIIRG
ncbi:MAG: hypothetical protein KA118_18250 [Verrucomicrobia bacterium]|jgi:hypothetical protein|nr:hypothetical protein [Verrucomicrobiota bacterium]